MTLASRLTSLFLNRNFLRIPRPATAEWHFPSNCSNGVTGFYIFNETPIAARSNAEKAGVTIATVKASHDAFDFGVSKWDLIVLTFAWAPVTDPESVARLATSLRSGGRIVFEHFLDRPERPHPEGVRALKPGQLRTIFSDFVLEFHEKTEGAGDWGGPGSHLMRMIARKQ
jgi:hypothetical protein